MRLARVAPLGTLARLLPLAALALAPLALTACDPGAATPSSSASATGPAPTSAAPSPSVSPVVTPTPPALDPHPAPADLVVSAEGILPLTIGLPPASNPGAAMISYDEDYCYSEEMGTTEGDLGRWTANYPDVMDVYGYPKNPFYLAADDTSIYRLDVFDQDMPTTEGITIGSTLADVQAAYPALVEGTPGPVSRIFWVTGTRGYLVFETQDPDAGLGVPGATGPEEVILMRVITIAGSPDFAAANSGNIAGACF